MIYHNNLFKFLLSMDDHLFRIKQAEKIRHIWKVNGILLVCAILIYGWMAYLGMGTAILSPHIANLSPLEYEQQKFWFMIGRMVYATLFVGFVLFVPSLFYYALLGISLQKLIVMQQVVLLVMLAERLIWIPLAVFNGLDWYVSPFSFGIIASYLTEHVYFIYFFGMISLFQIWIIYFQVKYLRFLSDIRHQWLWFIVIGWHLFFWAIAAVFVFADQYLLSRWFG
ncbi:MAG: DUF3667 domain-containing protein [Virgibacillus proomii]|jgi:hypothetical protein